MLCPSLHLKSDSMSIWFEFQMVVRENSTQVAELQRDKGSEERFSTSPGLKFVRVRHAKLHDP